MSKVSKVEASLEEGRLFTKFFGRVLFDDSEKLLRLLLEDLLCCRVSCDSLPRRGFVSLQGCFDGR